MSRRLRSLPDPDALPAVLVARQTAALLGLSEDAVRAAAERGELPATITTGCTGKRIYRFEKAKILALRSGSQGVDEATLKRVAEAAAERAAEIVLARLGLALSERRLVG